MTLMVNDADFGLDTVLFSLHIVTLHLLDLCKDNECRV